MATLNNNPITGNAPNEAEREQARRLAERYRCPFVDLREQRIARRPEQRDQEPGAHDGRHGLEHPARELPVRRHQKLSTRRTVNVEANDVPYVSAGSRR